jgi:hypothetical protein
MRFIFSVREIVLRVSFNFSLRDYFVKPLTPNPSPVGRGEIVAGLKLKHLTLALSCKERE